MPQVWRHAARLSNQWLVLLKIRHWFLMEDLMSAELVNTVTHQPFHLVWHCSVIDLTITLISQFIIRKLEFRFTRFERGVE